MILGPHDTAILEVLAAAIVPMDPVHIAEAASLLPADVDAALAGLVRDGLVTRVESGRPDRRARYQAVTPGR